MIFIALKLDDKRIIKDKKIDLEDAYKIIIKAYKSKDAYLFKEENDIKYFTREKDSDDFQYLWMVSLALDKINWFKKYVTYWRYVETGDDRNIEYEEDLIPNVEI